MFPWDRRCLLSLFFVVSVGSFPAGDPSIPTSPQAAAAKSPAESSGPEFIRIPAGPFQMGDTLDDTDYALPVHAVFVDEFYLDRYETTYSLWKEVCDWAVAHGYRFENAGRNGSLNEGDNQPVVEINWFDAAKWLNARSEKEGRTPVYYTDDAQTVVYRRGRADLSSHRVKWSADGFRLPTEAEWEKAARGGLEGKRYPWGDELGTGNANHDEGGTVAVGSYKPNGYGLCDMAGNVFEWVWDWGSEGQAYDWAVDGDKNPRGPDSSPLGRRVRRGGSYSYGSRYLKCAERMFRDPTYTAPYFGFRSATNKLR